tara:strand:+ start:1394 stop:1852 length:459 start_codon:yes stop_codon:yes gene_type:complete
MKLTTKLLKQLIQEAKKEKDQIFKSDLSAYELEDLDSDRQTIALLGEILNQLKTLVYYSTPARGAIGASAEKALASTVQEGLGDEARNLIKSLGDGEELDQKQEEEVLQIIAAAIQQTEAGKEAEIVPESALQAIEDLIRREISIILNEKEI